MSNHITLPEDIQRGHLECFDLPLSLIVDQARRSLSSFKLARVERDFFSEYQQ